MDSCTIFILGDICPRWGNGEQFDTMLPSSIFHGILPLFEQGKLIVANLEAPATDSNTPLPKNSMNLKATPDDIRLLADCGIHGMSLANNHILDYGLVGLKDTISNISNSGMFCYGAGMRGEEGSPHIINIDGMRIGLLAFSEHEFNCAVDYGMGANLWNDIDSLVLIRKAKEQCDYLIVQYHGGIEEYKYPSPVLQKKCRAMVDMGADLVTCQHSHCVGTRESWNGAEILYGQGNFIFGYEENNMDWNRGLIIRIDIHLNKKITYIPIEAKFDGSYLMEKDCADHFLSQFYVASEKIKDENFIIQTWRMFCNEHKNSYFPMLFGWGRVGNKLNRLTNGKLVRLLTKNVDRRNAMNLIRCDAHREVVTTILEMDYYD